MVGNVNLDADVIELRDWKILSFPPPVTAVIRVPETAIIARDHMVRVVRIDPNIVKVSMRSTGYVTEAAPAVTACYQRPVRFVYLVFVFRIDDQVSEIERAPDHVLTTIELFPRLAFIIRSIKSILRHLRFNKRIDRRRFRRSNGNGDASPWFSGKTGGTTVGKFFPGGASVCTLE